MTVAAGTGFVTARTLLHARGVPVQVMRMGLRMEGGSYDGRAATPAGRL